MNDKPKDPVTPLRDVSSDTEEQPETPPESLILIDEHEEEVSVDGKTIRRRGIYLLPNLFTTAALFSGFYAVIAGMNGKFEAIQVEIAPELLKNPDSEFIESLLKSAINASTQQLQHDVMAQAQNMMQNLNIFGGES